MPFSFEELELSVFSFIILSNFKNESFSFLTITYDLSNTNNIKQNKATIIVKIIKLNIGNRINEFMKIRVDISKI
jgi:uncharacterized protein (DUF608 family)